MEKKINFISGLPRAGSTLLCNILAQNPKFHATATSGILNVMVMIRNQWSSFEEFAAAPEHNMPAKKRVLKSTLFSYHAEPENKVIFDKSRGWLAYMEMAEMVLGKKAKVLVPVRDLRDVLASLEKLWRANAATRALSQEIANQVEWKTLAGRCKVWADASQLVGQSYNNIKDALERGFKDRMHFVPFEDLTGSPKKTLKGIYDFLDEEVYDHDFNNVEQVTVEDDLVYGMQDLHKIRRKVEKMEPQWPSILGEEIAKNFEGQECW